MKPWAFIRTVWTAGRGVLVGLPDASDDRDPLDLFGEWYRAAERSGILLPEAMTLATCTPDGRPSARMVLMKNHGPDGLTFYSNRESRKGEEMEQNPRGALVFHWSVLQRQVRVEGAVEPMSQEASDPYFQQRLRGSRIGAWASLQSRRLNDRTDLEERVARYENEFRDQPVPLPPFWGGYLLRPDRMEFWQGRASRLHDRLVFERKSGEWTASRLYP